METSSLILMVTVWVVVISFLTYFLRKAVKTQKKE